LCIYCQKKLQFDIKKSFISNYTHYFYSYYSDDLKQLFYSIKFDYNKHLLIEFSNLFLNRGLDKCLSEFDYFVPIPYHSSRLNSRGYNVLDYLFLFLEKKI